MKIINSPIVITIIIIISAFVLKTQMKTDLALEIRGAYDEIISIAEDAGSDTGKTRAIQDFAEQIALQLKQGFSAGFSSNRDENGESPDEKFLRIKKNVHVTEVRQVQSEWPGKQSILFRVENKSEYPIKQIRVNLEFYKGGKLFDVKNEWLNEVTVLDTDEIFTAKKDRNIPNQLTEEEKAEFTFDEVKVFVTSFHIISE